LNVRRQTLAADNVTPDAELSEAVAEVRPSTSAAASGTQPRKSSIKITRRELPVAMMNLTIRDLFNFISSHFPDDFARLKTATSFSNFITHYDSTEIANKYNNITDFKFANLSTVIESIFDAHNPILCGESAIAFIDFMKNKHSSLPPINIKWISQELLTLCLNTDTTAVSSNFVITETQNNHADSPTSSLMASSESAPLQEQATSNDNLNNNTSFLGSLRTDINTDITDQLKFFMLNSLPKTAKDEHFQDLERMLNKKTDHKRNNYQTRIPL